MTRRDFLRAVGAQGGGVVLGPFLLRRSSAEVPPVKIGQITPRSGPWEGVGEATAMGAQLGIDEINVLGALFGRRFVLVQEAATTPEAASRAATKLITEDQVVAILAGMDDASTATLGGLAQQRGVLFLNCGARADALRGEACHRFTFHVEASLDMYADALAQWLVRREKRTRWYLLSDDSPRGRAAIRAARRAVARQGGAPVGEETTAAGSPDHRARIERIKAASPDVLFVGLAGADHWAFLEQYRASGLPFVVAGFLPDVASPATVGVEAVPMLWPSLWYHTLDRYSARELNSRFRRRFRRSLDDRAWASWAAIKMVGEAVIRTASSHPRDLVRFLEGAPRFDGHKGTALTFREWDHQLRQPIYLVAPRKTAQDAPAGGPFEVVGEVPLPDPRGEGEAMDTLGISRTESRCRFDP